MEAGQAGKKTGQENRSYFSLDSFKPGKYLYFFALLLVAFIIISSISVLLLKWVYPRTSAFMVGEHISAWWNGVDDFELEYRWTEWDDISPYIKIAAVTAEDQRFPDHFGFDLTAIEKAIEESQQGERLRGASTITQQVAKNLFLWPGRSFLRKGIEAYFTVLLELFLSKKRILEIYLNIAQFGENIYGVGAACRIYFDVEPGEMDIMQSALLVTVLPNPVRYNLNDPSPYMIERRNWVIEYMFYLGYKDLLKRLE